MAWAFVVGLRNAIVNAITAQLDAGAGAAKIRLYDGVRPASGGAATVLLAEMIMTDPSFPAGVGGVITASPVSGDVSADSDGTATWARFVDSNNVFVQDGDVGVNGSGADVELNSVSIVAGTQVDVTSVVFTAPNP